MLDLLLRLRRWFQRHETLATEPDTMKERHLLEQILLCFARYAFETSERTAEGNRALWQSVAELVRRGRLDEIPTKTCEYRRSEHSFVSNQLNDLRDLAWTLISGMSQLIHQEGEDSNALKTHLQQLDRQMHTSGGAIPVEVLKSTLQSLTEVLNQRVQRHQQVLSQLQSQVHDLMQELEQARRESALDPLTQLYNRRALEAHLRSTIELNRLFGYPAVLILLDLDQFKQVNDQYGHLSGDEVLKEVARRLVSVCKRKSDFVARYGGEEFAIVLREATLKDGKKIAQRIAEAIRSTPIRLPDGQTIHMTVSLGVSQLQSGETPEAWLHRTDQLLYQAKQTGRNRLCA